MAALQAGLRYDEAMSLPLGDVLDVINALKIKNGMRYEKGCADTENADDDSAEFWALLERK